MPQRELNRLRSDNKTSDWKLPGGSIIDRRTRGKKKQFNGKHDENVSPSPPPLPVPSPPESINEESDDNNDDPTRVILETRGLRHLLESNIRCPTCNTPVKVEIKNICIHSHVDVSCQSCKWRDSTGKGRLTDFRLPEGSGSPLIERTTDYAINVMYVLSHLSVGDGGREAE